MIPARSISARVAPRREPDGKFLQDAAARTIDEKLADAAQVHQFTGCCPRFLTSFGMTRFRSD